MAPATAARSEAPSFAVLNAHAPAERARWLDAWQAWPDREVHAHPAFLEAFAAPGHRVCCALFQHPDGRVLLPFTQRPLALEPWCPDDHPASDIVGPYGYGAAFCTPSAGPWADAFWPQFQAWATERSIVSAFFRLSLFPESSLPFPGDTVPRFSNVVVPLDAPLDAIIAKYARKVRKNIRRAEKSGLSVEVDTEGRHLDAFLDIYAHTMARRDAAEGYRFDRSFFEDLHRALGTGAVFFHVLHEGQIISTELVLVSEHHLYSFLGGTLEAYFELRPNDFLKHEIIRWGQAQKKRGFVLGGGYGEDDGIYRYKLSFAPDGARPFSVGQWTLCPETAAELGALRQAHARDQGQIWEMPTAPSSFFPPYRAPAKKDDQ